MKTITLSLIVLCLFTGNLIAQEGWVAGDFHQHTRFTDGDFSMEHVMKKGVEFGLDWWANSEHGGAYEFDGRVSGDEKGILKYWQDDSEIVFKGKENYKNSYRRMWRWQMLGEYSFPHLLQLRQEYPSNVIIHGYEMNVPGHEHASMVILCDQFKEENPNIDAIAEFEFMFDARDYDETGGAGEGWTKSTKENHAKTLEALEWLNQNHQNTSYVIPAHPERKKKYTISDFRDMNNVAPDVCFGFESIPGHQKQSERGGYEAAKADGGGTFGGAGVYCAQVGGLWDAMLSEGRNWWLFANSDFHDEERDFYPGEYLKTYTYVSDKTNPQSIINGLRSGNSWVVMGDLINSLDFSVEAGDKIAVMGQNVNVEGQTVTVKIKVKDPQGTNFCSNSEYNTPELHHIDLIMGEVSDYVEPTSDDYNNPSVETTRVIARFDANGGEKDSEGITSNAWNALGNGEYEMEYVIINVTKPIYLRLRGTNMGLDVENETDAAGNPLSDFNSPLNGEDEAYADLWFYSNPIFINTGSTTAINDNVGQENNIVIAPNPTNGVINIANLKAGFKNINILSSNGAVVKSITSNEEKVTIDIANQPQGIYIVSVITNGSTENFKVIKK